MDSQSYANKLISRLPDRDKLTTGDLAAVFDCTRRQIRELIECGKLNGINLGKTSRPAYRISRASAIEYINKNCF